MMQMGGCGIFRARSINCIPSSLPRRRSVRSRSIGARLPRMQYLLEVKRGIFGGLGTILLLTGAAALADEPPASVDSKEGWKLSSQPAGVAIYSRPHPGSPVKEFRAIGEIDAPTPIVNAVIDDFESYPRFMPF